MLFKYFIEFDDDGEIKKFSKYREKCKDCKEYIVKLMPIERKQENVGIEADRFGKAADKLISDAKKFETKINKVLKGLRRIK